VRVTASHHVYLIPGMFGFGRLAGYDYFHHVREALSRRYADAGVELVSQFVRTPPTSSLRHRGRILAKAVQSTAGTEGPIHLLGHSTGGLDTRLVLSPSTNLQIAPERLSWTPRVLSSVCINTPHYGTPLASYFSTVSGTRVLYALSLLTVVSLSIGEPSLAVFSKLLAGVGGLERLVGGDLRLISRLTDLLLRFVDEKGRGEIHDYLTKVRLDQGAIIQIMPEAMDLFNASAEDDHRIRYGCVATAAPPPHPIRFAKRVRSPYAAFSAAMFSTLYQFAGQQRAMYPYARPTAREQELLSHGIEHEVSERANDGIVPTLSMLWGKLIWCGEADHLDVLGHFPDDQRPRKHVDWLASGAPFTRQRFEDLMDAIVKFQLDQR
jgi:triacylglycerol lipase